MLFELYEKIMNQTATAEEFFDFYSLLLIQTIGGVLLTPKEALEYVRNHYSSNHLEG